MEFVVGYDMEAFRQYYRTLEDLADFAVKRFGKPETEPVELQECEKSHIERDPSHLIAWVEDGVIIGHVIWHETSTDEMTPGDPRDEDDRGVLRRLFGGRRENLVELHEVWLRTEHRGKGHGRRFFSFFEDFALDRGYSGIVYYTDNPAATAICRQRRYRDGFLEREGWNVFALRLTKRST